MLNSSISRRQFVKAGVASVAVVGLPLSVASKSFAAPVSAGSGLDDLSELEATLDKLEFMRSSVSRLRDTRLNIEAMEVDRWGYRRTAGLARDIAESLGIDTSGHMLAPTEAALEIEQAAILELDTQSRALRFKLGMAKDAVEGRRLTMVDRRMRFYA